MHRIPFLLHLVNKRKRVNKEKEGLHCIVFGNVFKYVCSISIPVLHVLTFIHSFKVMFVEVT